MFFLSLCFMALYGKTLIQTGSRPRLPERDIVCFVSMELCWNALNQVTTHSNARCSLRHLGMGLGGQTFCSNSMEMIENAANLSRACASLSRPRLPERDNVCSCSMALCVNTLKLPDNNNYLSRASCSPLHLGVGLFGESICWKHMRRHCPS